MCEAASCISGNASDITARLRELTEKQSDVQVKRVGCLGMSYIEPTVEVAVPGEPARLYANVAPEDALGIVRRHFRAGGLLRTGPTATNVMDLALVALDGRV